jgi:Ca2+-binding RTX toxin-like protein
MALVNGPGGGDTLFGTPAADLIQGFDVDDLLFGFGGNDTLSGGEAFDRVDGGAGNDTYIMIDRWDLFFESTGEDTAIVQADFVKPAEGVEHWNLTSGVKALPFCTKVAWIYKRFFL